LNKSENFKLYDNYEGHSNFFADRWNTLRLKFSISNSDTLLVEYDNICDEIKNMTTIGITQQELDSQKKKIEKNLKSIYSDANQFSFFVTSHLNAGFTLEELKDYWNNYNNVTLDQVNRSLLKLFDLDNIYIVAVGDKKQSESFINNFDNVELYNYKDKLK
jgi:predicted Zn-dependent peptidase